MVGSTAHHALTLGHIGEANYAQRLKLLADESMALARCLDIDSLLDRVTRAARSLVGAHQAVASLTIAPTLAQAIHAAALSDKYAAWRAYDEQSDGSGIYRLVCEFNQPMRLTQAELEAHPAWKGFGDSKGRHPPMRGWLAVPIVSHSGRNLGLIQLSDKLKGEFTENDEHELTLLASITGVAIDNLLAGRAREAALAEATAARAEIETVLTSISDAVYVLDPGWNFVFLNTEAQRIMNPEGRDLVGRTVWDCFPEARGTIIEKEFTRARDSGQPGAFEVYYPPLQGWFDARVFPHAGGITVYFHDITQRVEIEERLRQSEKMDAIGQLTGGVAHDFNNLLTVILGSADAVAEYLVGAPPEVQAQAEVIRRAGERAAELTHRLLAFARKQPLDPRLTDLNLLVDDIEDLLRRTLGEDIAIELRRAETLGHAIVDPHQLHNALLNLALNARDAMPAGGRLTIATANVTLGPQQAEAEGLQPGRYVAVTVSDTGQGMSPETLAKAFEPFYTTKEEGRGSGLGLSMVYGFARQSGGQVAIASQVGQGTTVRLYLPRAESGGEPAYRPLRPAPVEHGNERLLLVEDDAYVRSHLVGGLRALGYSVTACAEGPEALMTLERESGFDLLLTDVVLSGGLSGKQVAAEAVLRRPSLKVLYMSGYPEDAITQNGRLEHGVRLLSKPFRLSELARKIREVLAA